MLTRSACWCGHNQRDLLIPDFGTYPSGWLGVNTFFSAATPGNIIVKRLDQLNSWVKKTSHNMTAAAPINSHSQRLFFGTIAMSQTAMAQFRPLSLLACHLNSVQPEVPLQIHARFQEHVRQSNARPAGKVVAPPFLLHQGGEINWWNLAHEKYKMVHKNNGNVILDLTII